MLRRILAENRPDGLSWEYPVFGWPIKGYGNRTGGVRLIKGKVFGKPKVVDVAQRRRAAEAGRLDRHHPMPAIYHGCLSRGFLDKMSRSDGTCILSCSPDTYVNYRAIQHGGDFLHSNHPFSINGYSPASTGGSIASQGSAADKSISISKTKFELELKTDPIEDVIPLSKSTALGFLGTVETVRHHFPEPALTLNYESWYVGVLGDMRGKDASTRGEIYASLREHAAKYDALPALKAAQQPWRQSLRRLSVTVDKNIAKINSFRVQTNRGGENTILTAAYVCDALLGQDFDDVLSGKLGRSAGWGNVKSRLKQQTTNR
ncbi:MAG: hypothetical protein QNK92_08915 [Amylibacter sp.]